jgi:hypothetical protein
MNKYQWRPATEDDIGSIARFSDEYDDNYTYGILAEIIEVTGWTPDGDDIDGFSYVPHGGSGFEKCEIQHEHPHYQVEKLIKELLLVPDGCLIPTSGVCVFLAQRVDRSFRSPVYGWTLKYAATFGTELFGAYVDTPGFMTPRRRKFCELLLENISRI